MQHRHRRLIERLGGYVAVAEALGRHPSTVFRWQTTGIPPSCWPTVERLAKAAGIRGATIQLLGRDSPRYGIKGSQPSQAP